MQYLSAIAGFPDYRYTRQTMKTFLRAGIFACALISLLCFAIPMYVIRPFRAQGPTEFPFALAVRQQAPLVSALCALVAIALLLGMWPQTRSIFARTSLVLCVILAAAGVALARINIFEIMFHPYPAPEFVTADSAQLGPNEMVLSVTQGSETHAWPVGAIGYHHIVNDVVGGEPVAATYCTLCHTGIVWSRIVDGQTLTFRLTGIRNGNALLRDEQTGSIWQQTTGVAIFGPLKGKQLRVIHSDELTFALWRTGQPRGLILKPNPEFASLYEKPGWEKEIEQTTVVVSTAGSGAAPHELMLGIATASASKAFPWKTVLSAQLIQDTVGDVPVLLIVGPDHVSARAFRTAPHVTFVRTDSGPDVSMTDVETSGNWNFSGCAISGPHTGDCLQPLDAKKDYWFDWLNYHPATSIYH